MTWIALALLLGLSGLVSGSETAVFSLRPAERRRLVERRGLLGGLLRRPTRLLVTLLLGNLLVNVAYFSLSASVSLAYAGSGRTLASVLVALGTLVGLVIFGEILPKTLALAGPARLVTRLGPLLVGLSVVLGPAAALGGALTRLLQAVIVPGTARAETLDTEDFKSALSGGAAIGTYHAVELALLHDVIDFGVRRARTMMVPRVDVAFLDVRDPFEAWAATMAAQPHTDYPVIDGSPDNLLGTLNAGRLLAHPERARETLIEPALLAPLGIRAELLVLRMQEGGRHLAILLDEFGGVAGVVGLAELSQAVLGEVDPLPEREIVPRPRGPGLLARGGCPVDVLRDELGLELETRRAHTLAGALAEALGRVPRRGDELLVGGWRLRVAAVRGRRVERVILRPRTDAVVEANA